MIPIISINEFLNLPKDRFVLVNAGSGDKAYNDYQQAHPLNALYVDLNKDLSEVPSDAAFGGRHPLPSPEKFSNVLMRIGIDQQSHVIIYDHQGAANAASRFWWMLKAAGLENVQVIDGGWQELQKFNYPMTSEMAIPKKVEQWTFDQWNLPLVDINFVEENVGKGNYLVIDVREKNRYNGESEPIDLIAGHIPGAKNVFFKHNLTKEGTFKSPKELRDFYQNIINDVATENVVIHCGSGVTACHTLLALDYAGFKMPNLYVGSWSEWSRNQKPITTKKNN